MRHRTTHDKYDTNMATDYIYLKILYGNYLRVISYNYIDGTNLGIYIWYRTNRNCAQKCNAKLHDYECNIPTSLNI